MHKPVAQEPTLSQLSDFPDEPLHLSQQLEERLALEFEFSETQLETITGPRTAIEQKQSEIKDLFRQIARVANINHFYFTEDIDKLNPTTKRLRLGAMQKSLTHCSHLWIQILMNFGS